ncbi:MAG: hypothetical protein RSE54_10380 [Ruthenibacterium sp.]
MWLLAYGLCVQHESGGVHQALPKVVQAPRLSFSEAKSAKIHAESKELIARQSKNPLPKVMVQKAIAQLNAVSKTAEVFRMKINWLAKKLSKYEVAMSLHNTRKFLAPQLIAEIGNVRRFAHNGALTAFASVNQSETL